MGRLFEGVTFDFQKEIKKAGEKAREEAREEARKEAQEQMQEKLQEKLQEMRQENMVARHIAKMLLQQRPINEIKDSLKQVFNLTEEQVEEEYQKIVE